MAISEISVSEPERGRRNWKKNKRMLIHVAAFNLGMLMRRRFGVGTPRGLQSRPAAAQAVLDSCATGAAGSVLRRFCRQSAALEPLLRLLGPLQAQLREFRAFAPSRAW